MKWLLVSTAALGVAMTAPAGAATSATTAGATPIELAQATQDNPPEHRKRAHDQNKGQQGQGQHDQGQQHQQTGGMGGQSATDHGAMDHRSGNEAAKFDRFDWSHYQPGQRPSDWAKHPSIDIHVWQRNGHAERRYHWRPYRRPPGWYAHTWVFGVVLPQLFWTRDNWIDDYDQFGLPNPPYGYVWVRDGDDALLVNVSNGYVLQIEYGLFD